MLCAAIHEFISSLIKFLGFIKALKYLKFWTPSNTCPFIIRSCSKFVTFLFICKYFVLLFLVTSSALTASSLICVASYSVAVTDRPSINTSSAYALCCLVLLEIVPFKLVCVFLITFSSTILNSAVDSVSPLSAPNASVNWPRFFTFLFEFCIILY